MAKSAQMIAQKWANGMGSASAQIKAGVESVTTNPAEAAIRQIPQYLAGVQRAVADGKVEAGLRRTTLRGWQDAMIQKGLSRVGPGAQAAKGDFEQFMGEFLPHLEAGERMLQNMPRGDLQTNVARAVAMIEHNAKFKRK
jgi:hypothetical protein